MIGPLAGRSIRLARRSVVTTTWGEWRRRHPETTVLALETGFSRNYGEGVAYREYFSTDDLMFNVAVTDKRLANKAEVLGLVFDEAKGESLAIEIDYLEAHPVYHGELGGRKFVVFTDRSGAARVYESGGITFKTWDRDRVLRDDRDRVWKLFEDRIESETGKKLLRLPQHRAFWFGWYAAFPQTRLVYNPR